MTQEGELAKEQIRLLFAHMPVGFSVADEDDVVRFWAGDTFADCSPKLIGRDLYASHPKRAHAGIESLLADFKSGAKDRSTRSSTAATAPSASSTPPCGTPMGSTGACWRPCCRSASHSAKRNEAAEARALTDVRWPPASASPSQEGTPSDMRSGSLLRD